MNSPTASPGKFVKPADLFKMRRSSAIQMEAQSPLKCLNNLMDPSPTKKLPVLLRNPFNQPVKRKLNLGNELSPKKRSKILEIDEDANLDFPEKISNSCYRNDWVLRTKLRVDFEKSCNNWNKLSKSTHKRVEDTPSKPNDHTISIEAIKNVSTVYQHPYFSWLPLYPRTTLEFERTKEAPLTFKNHPQISKMMHKDWCESFNDLTNLLIDGKCPYFYMCSDTLNILFTRTPTMQACIAPFSYGLGCELNKAEVEFRCPDLNRSSSSSGISAMTRQDNNSRASFASYSMPNKAPSTVGGEECSQDSRQQAVSADSTKITTSMDSGNVSDPDELILDESENDEASQFLEEIGISQTFPLLQTKRKAYTEGDSNTNSTSNKPLGVVSGVDNILKLIKFLQSNRLYTIKNIGQFAGIPPTLLSPREFRLSTPQHPEVITSPTDRDTESNKSGGPTFVELRGTILPNLYVKIHKLLSASDNRNHTCVATSLDSSVPFGSLQYV